MRGAILGCRWLASAILLAIGGCDHHDVKPAERNGTDWSTDDQVLSGIVLEDLRTNKEFRSYPAWASRPMIVVWNESNGSSWYVSKSQISSELRYLPPLSDDLYEALESRNRGKILMRTVELENVVYAPELKRSRGEQFSDAFENRYPDAKAYVGFWLPAYSADGETALVRFSFGPTAHGACGTTLLEKTKGSWKVKWRKLSYYA